MASSESDDDMRNVRRCRSRRPALEAETEEETATSRERTSRSRIASNQSRRSERIQCKRNKTLRRLTRDDQWNAIPTENVSSARIAQLKPRKLVNDFTRMTHRYNYDPAETSGEESMNEFINDSSSTSDSHSPTEPKQIEHRIKGYRPRIAHYTESESSDDNHSGSKDEVALASSLDIVKSPPLPMQEQEKNNTGQENCSLSAAENDTEEIISPRRKTNYRKLSVLSSDSGEEETSVPRQDTSAVNMPSSHQTGAVPSENVPKNAPNSLLGDKLETESETTSDSDDTSFSVGRIQKLADKRRKLQNTMFNEFRESHAKRLKH